MNLCIDVVVTSASYSHHLINSTPCGNLHRHQGRTYAGHAGEMVASGVERCRQEQRRRRAWHWDKEAKGCQPSEGDEWDVWDLFMSLGGSDLVHNRFWPHDS
jgi:hypothetical protein